MKNKITASLLILGFALSANLASADPNSLANKFHRQRIAERQENTVKKALPYIKKQGCSTDVRNTEVDYISGGLYLETSDCICEIQSRPANANGGGGFFGVECVAN